MGRYHPTPEPLNSFLRKYEKIVLDSLKVIKYYHYMSQSTISTFQLFAMIPDAETARLYLEATALAERGYLPNLQRTGPHHDAQGRLLSLQQVQTGLYCKNGNHL